MLIKNKEEQKMKNLQAKANEIRKHGVLIKESGNATWHHKFYKMPIGNLMEISYKNGKLAEINNLGR